MIIGPNWYYVYTLAYPDGTVFYVGKGKGYRIDDHEREARNGIQSYKCHTIRKIWAEGGQVIKRKRGINLSEEEAYRLECEIIKEYGRDNLTNMNDGGVRGGRPKTLQGEYKLVVFDIRKDLLAKIDASGKSRREYIEQLLEQ